MTPQQALNLLDQLISNMNLNRANHIQAQQAVEILKKALKPKK